MFNPGFGWPTPEMVSPYTLGLGVTNEATISSNPASSVYESANLAVYHPVYVPSLCTVRRVWWANGATTAGTSNVEVGIYYDDNGKPGRKVVSGSALQGTASTVQFVTVTAVAIPAGLYWIATVADATVNTTFFKGSPGSYIDMAMRYQQASAYPLPATATPVASTSNGIYLAGFSTRSSP